MTSILRGVDRITAVPADDLPDFARLPGCTCTEVWVHPVTNFVGQVIELELGHSPGCPRLRQTEVRR